MSYPPRTIDAAETLLKSQGWSVGDMSFVENGRQCWAVHCHRGHEWRNVFADTQLEAWQRAVERCYGNATRNADAEKNQ